eukprot:CAMPEP_0181343204 /NCGR_PEP_ID=MMETSP1101-20121128/31453_1 /TAXON_ID=46948 /ORGANISM="Rhodomonas abbreviata, Strain Caron Lab Isolate" /LENGTH=110 /DNA_ID=CAMNT_0023454801 /DNA_START=23 /DNA_END=355 /DNA_ORIENTATION=+
MEYPDGSTTRAPDGSPLPFGPVLYACNKYFAQECKGASDSYWQCKKENGDPRACLKPGENVVACFNSVIKRIDAACPQHLTAYAKCLDGNKNEFEKCRKEQKALEDCSPP